MNTDKLTIAKPTSAFFKAGPSLVPSPVTATTCLCSTTVLSIIPRNIKHEDLKCKKLVTTKHSWSNLNNPEIHNYLSLRCVCLLGKSEPVLEVWARSCQCVLVQSGNMTQNPNRIPTVHFQQSLRYSILLCPTSPFSLRILRLNSLPSRQIKSSPGCRIPHLLAMARAVFMLSPVTIRTVMPARWHFLMASGT